MTSAEWIASIALAAKKASEATGMSYELMLAQAAQETGWGKKILPGTNNLFNIKADSSWTGDVKTFQVPEYINGQWVSATIFTMLANDSDLSDNLVLGGADASALDINDYLIYNNSTKALYYDADGSDTGTAVQFATLNNVNTLNTADFIVI